MTRVLPDVDLLALDVVRAKAPTIDSGTQPPSVLGNKALYISARGIPGGGAPVHPKLAASARVSVDVWGANRKAVSDLAEDIRVAFYDAHRLQTVFTHGHITFQQCVSGPSEVPPPDGSVPQSLYRFQALYRLVVRN